MKAKFFDKDGKDVLLTLEVKDDLETVRVPCIPAFYATVKHIVPDKVPRDDIHYLEFRFVEVCETSCEVFYKYTLI